MLLGIAPKLGARTIADDRNWRNIERASNFVCWHCTTICNIFLRLPCQVVSVVFLAPLRLGDVIDLEVLDSIPFVAVGLFFSGLSCCFMVVPAMPALLVGIDTNDEGGQAWVTGMFGTFFALGTTAGPLIADLLMDMQVSLFCRATDWPIISNTTTQAVALVSTTLSPVSNSTDPYNKQHCFDGTFTVLGFVGVLYSVVFWIFLCDYSRVQRKNNEVRMGE